MDNLLTENSNIIVASGFFIDPIIWNRVINRKFICADHLRISDSTTLDNYVDYIISQLDSNKPVKLIGHSYGCALLIHLASIIKNKITTFIMLNGIIPDKNSVFEAYQISSQNKLISIVSLDYSKGKLQLKDKNIYSEYLFEPGEKQAIQLQQYENINLITSKINCIKDKKYPVIYVASKEDNLTSYKIQEDQAIRARADKFISIDGGHMSAFFNKEHWIQYAN